MFCGAAPGGVREAFQKFAEAIQANSQFSMDKEPGCHRFDVCKDPDDTNSIFLYEVYENRESFGLHLESEHYKKLCFGAVLLSHGEP